MVVSVDGLRSSLPLSESTMYLHVLYQTCVRSPFSTVRDDAPGPRPGCAGDVAQPEGAAVARLGHDWRLKMTVSMREQLKNQSGSYLPRLVAVRPPLRPRAPIAHSRARYQVLYAVFDPREGPKIVSQVPEGSVATALSTFPAPKAPAVPSAAEPAPPGLVRSTSEQGLSSTQVLFDFSSILDFVIPKPELCGHLITKATRTSKILGFPIQCVVALWCATSMS